MNKPWPCLKCLGVIMKAVDDDHCQCPNCGTEVWYDYNMPSEKDQIEEALENNGGYVSRSLPEGYKVPAGGSKSGSSSKKEQMKKKSGQRLFNQLFKQT